MKKIVGILAAAAVLATSVFAADISARLVQKGSLAGGYDGNVYVLGMGKTHQKDADLIQFSASTDKAGASFRLWADMADDEAVKVRKLSFWFKPVDMLKVTIGFFEPGLYTERLDWWKVGTAEYYGNVNGWGGVGRYSGACMGDGYGINLELTPVDGLTIAAQFAPGTGNAWLVAPKEGDSTYAKWGAMAKYQIADNISAGAAFRDNGKDSWKQIRAGVEFGNWGTPYYGFVQPVMLMNGVAKDSGLDGVCIDNYFSYNFGFMNLQARIPVTIRMTDNDGDPSYMLYNIKASFPQDGWTPYVQIQSFDLDDDGTFSACTPTMHKVLRFDEFKFNANIHAGAVFNFGAVSLDVAAVVNIDTDEGAKTGWYVPFIAAISF